MYYYLKLISAYLLFSVSLSAQNIQFDNPSLLFEHPSDSEFGMKFPFIPMDYNQDGVTDFIGATFSDQYLYRGLAVGGYEENNSLSGDTGRPLKVLDFDQDGDLDILMARSIYLYESQDSFTQIKILNFGTEEIVGSEDFNSDGLEDLLIQVRIIGEPDELYIYYNMDEGNFSDQLIYNKYGNYGDIEIGDVDGDGSQDIVFLLFNEDNPGVVLYNKENSFEAILLQHEFKPRELTLKLVDLDDDGDLDIMACGQFNDLYLLKNEDQYRTDSTFNLVEFKSVKYFDLADMDQDGDLDIVAAQLNWDDNKWSIYILTNLEIFEFSTPERVADFTKPGSFTIPGNVIYAAATLSLYDYDVDGLIDIIYTDGFGDPKAVYGIRNASQVSTSILQEQPNAYLKTYPNPVTDQIFLQGSSLTSKHFFTISNMVGQVLHQGIVYNPQIELSFLKPGMYILNVSHIGTTKFIKK